MVQYGRVLYTASPALTVMHSVRLNRLPASAGDDSYVSVLYFTVLACARQHNI